MKVTRQHRHRYFLLDALMFSVVWFLSAPDVFADLSKSKFTDLVATSDLILQARVVRAELTGPGQAGQAILSVKSVHKGVYPKSEITIRWSSEYHDQRVDRVAEDRLLFLKRNPAGDYEGTHYGRSYWVVYQGTYGRLFTPYSYPTTKIVMDVSNLLHSTAEVAPDERALGGAFGLQCQAAQVIFLDAVLAFIKAHG
jgi:hypothetical protein